MSRVRSADHRHRHHLVIGLARILDWCERHESGRFGLRQRVRAAVLDLLLRHGIEPVGGEGVVDPARHEVVATRHTVRPTPHPVVHEILRIGLQQHGHVLRRARVVVLLPAPPPQSTSSNAGD